MGLRVIQYQRQNYFTAVEECPLLTEMNPPHISLFSDAGRNRVSAFLWDSWSPLPALACRGILFQERKGGSAMTCPHKEDQVSVLSPKGWPLKSRQLIWKCPMNQDTATSLLHVHTPSHTGKLLPQAKSQWWLFWIGCKVIVQLQNSICQERLQGHQRAALNTFQSWQYKRISKDPPLKFKDCLNKLNT